jgi:hypothetical protein
MFTSRLLIYILRTRNSLLISTGFLTYVIFSIFFIKTGLPLEAANGLGCASGVGSAALIAFIDSWLGISSSILRIQKERQRNNIDRDLQSGKIGATQALETVIRQQLSAEINDIPWHHFAERARVKERAANRYWAIKYILPYTLPPESRLPLDDLCQHLYAVENIVAQYRQKNRSRLPPISTAKEIVDQVHQQRLLP